MKSRSAATAIFVAGRENLNHGDDPAQVMLDDNSIGSFGVDFLRRAAHNPRLWSIQGRDNAFLAALS